MNKLYCLVGMFFVCGVCEAQNLVPNGDFEQYSGCPTAGGGFWMGQFDSTLFWMNPAPYPPGGSPDYFNQCTSGSLNVPNTWVGYQQAHSGVAYCGIGQWSYTYPDFREYIEAHLTSTLTANSCYHFEMFMSAANAMQYVTSNIQIYFSDTAITGINNWNVLPYIPQVLNGAGNIPDTLNWTLVSGDYTASGNEQYLIIGNFYNDSLTNTIQIDSTAPQLSAYVFVDDVSLTLSLCTGIEEQNTKAEIRITPNPFSDNLIITVKGDELFEVNLFDVTARKLFNQSFTNSTTINTEQLAKGIYLYEVRNKNGVVKKGKIVKD